MQSRNHAWTIFGVRARVIVECKRYSKKLGIGKVDEFVGKLLDTGGDMGILYAFSGVTPGARVLSVTTYRELAR